MNISDTIDGVKGFRVAGIAAGMKVADRLDLALIVSDYPCAVAGVFTTNEVKAAPVIRCQQVVAANADGIRAVVVNTGSANAMTGAQGLADAHETARLAGAALDVPPESVLTLSTGVIGLRLKMDKIAAGLPLAAANLGADWQGTARAIMTTDTRPKSCQVTVTTAKGESYTIAGIAKGAGMIAPNMATMLAFIVTDAALSAESLQAALKRAADQSFNRIVVDGDMSTNDTVLLLANGASGVVVDDQAAFDAALLDVSRALAQAIVRDGEGVSKFITIRVKGAESDTAAHKVANTIATSALVKTAFYGNDANWGRILAAAGRAGVPMDQTRVGLTIAPGVDQAAHSGLRLLHEGAPTDYAEADAHAIMCESEITVTLDLGLGDGETLVWTCDLSHDYVRINADYRS